MQYIGKSFIILFLTFMCQSAYSEKLDMKGYIKSEKINKGGVTLQIDGVGKVLIKSVTARTKRTQDGEVKSCLVDKKALKREIMRSFKNLAGNDIQKAKTREIKLKGEMDGGQMVCSSGGDNCTVIVAAWDPDDPVLPE